MRWSGPWTIVGRTLVANKLLAGSACGKQQRGRPLNAIVRRLGRPLVLVALYMINEIFYTFSTIAQALAGAIALLGAFVLFRLQSLNAEIDDLAMRLSLPLESVIGQEAKLLYSHRKYRELLTRFGTVTIQPGTYQAAFERERLPNLLEGRESFLLRFKVALYLTLSLIMFSVIILTIAEHLASLWWARVVFGIGLIWLGACLISYVALMNQSLK